MEELLRVLFRRVGLNEHLIERIRETVFGDEHDSGSLKRSYEWAKSRLFNERDAELFSSSFGKLFYEPRRSENERLACLTNVLLQIIRVTGLGFWVNQLTVLSAYINENNEKTRTDLKFVNTENGEETSFDNPDDAIEFFSNLLDNADEVRVSFSMRTRA